jgi:hypothetical protein
VSIAIARNTIGPAMMEGRLARIGVAPTWLQRRFGGARESPRPGRQPEDDRRPDVAYAQVTRTIVAVCP